MGHEVNFSSQQKNDYKFHIWKKHDNPLWKMFGATSDVKDASAMKVSDLLRCSGRRIPPGHLAFRSTSARMMLNWPWWDWSGPPGSQEQWFKQPRWSVKKLGILYHLYRKIALLTGKAKILTIGFVFSSQFPVGKQFANPQLGTWI